MYLMVNKNHLLNSSAGKMLKFKMTAKLIFHSNKTMLKITSDVDIVK